MCVLCPSVDGHIYIRHLLRIRHLLYKLRATLVIWLLQPHYTYALFESWISEHGKLDGVAFRGRKCSQFLALFRKMHLKFYCSLGDGFPLQRFSSWPVICNYSTTNDSIPAHILTWECFHSDSGYSVFLNICCLPSEFTPCFLTWTVILVGISIYVS